MLLVYIMQCDVTTCPVCRVVGNESITHFRKPESKVTRSFCSKCGSRVINRLEHRPDWLGFFPALLDESVQHDLPSNLAPTRHHLAEEATLNLEHICDGLPRP